MKVTIKTDKMPLNFLNGFSITAVDYQIATSPLFNSTEIISEVTKTSEDKFLHKIDYDFPNDEPIYGRVNFAFSNGENSGWSNPVKLEKDQLGFSFNNNVIKTPEVKLDKNYILESFPLGDFIIKSSEFFMFIGNGLHKSTSYIIENSNDEIVWKREKDETNLYSIKVPKNILEENKTYKIKIIHHNNYNSDSLPGELIITTIGDKVMFNVDEDKIELCNTGLSSIRYNHTLTNLEYVLISIVDDKNNDILKEYTSTFNPIYFRLEGIKTGERYKVIISAIYRDNKGNLVSTDARVITKIGVLCPEDSECTIDYNYQYKNNLRLLNVNLENIFNDSIRLDSGVREQLPNGDIMFRCIKEKTNELFFRFFKLRDNKLIDTGLKTKNYELLGSDDSKENCLNYILNENKIILNFNNASDVYVSIVDYIKGVNSSINFDNEIHIEIPEMNIPYTNGIINMCGGEMLIPIGETTLTSNIKPFQRLNISSLELIETILPNLNINPVIFKSSSTEVCVIDINNTPANYYIVNLEDEVITEVGEILPEMQNLNNGDNFFHTFTRKDGKTVLFPYTNIKENFNIFIYDPNDYSFYKIINHNEIFLPKNYIFPKKFIMVKMLNGSCLFIIPEVNELQENTGKINLWIYE